MSFSFNVYDVPASEAMDRCREDQYVPASIKEYVCAGIAALVTRYGEDVNVVVSAHGHLHTGEEGNYEVSSATIEVKKAIAKANPDDR